MSTLRVLAGLATAATVGGLAAAPTAGAATTPGPQQRLTTATGGHLVVRRGADGYVHQLAAPAGHPVPAASLAADRSAPSSAARDFLSRYRSLFGLADPGRQLREVRSTPLPGGQRVTRFQQLLDGGLPVFGGQLVVTTDEAGGVLFAGGETSHTARSTALRVPAATAAATAAAAVARTARLPRGAAHAARPVAQAYDPTLIGAPGAAGARAVWRVEVVAAGRRPVHQLVLVDAGTGAVTLRIDEHETATNRVVCDFGEQVRSDSDCTYARRTRVEGGAPVGIADVNSAYDMAGRVSDWYRSTLGYDLTGQIGSDYGDGLGKALRSTVRYCPEADWCPYDNAYWDGQQMVYGQGFPRAEDVVAHEMTHGVTQHTSGLVYAYQSGAINESMSDVFGELVDQSDGLASGDSSDAWTIGEQSPLGVIRSMSHPERYGQPDRMTSSQWYAGAADDGGVHTNSGVGNEAAYLIAHGGTLNGHTVAGLGLTKTAQLYFRVERLLTPGADYADLGADLVDGCQQLGFAATDCGQVQQAVDAVEMGTPPTRCAAPMPADFDADGYSDLAVWRPSTGRWYVDWVGNTTWGQSGDKPVAADYNCDNGTDLAVWRPSTGEWWVHDVARTVWGRRGDIPVPADFTGDGKADLAIWRPSNGQWWVRGASVVTWGLSGDVPVPGDYDGDGKADLAVWRPSTGRWYVRGIGAVSWGTRDDIPVVGDYDGDGKADLTVFRPSNGTWYVHDGNPVQFGRSGDKPAALDWDGDGRTDIVVYRPAEGRWYLRGFGDEQWGQPDDVPIGG